MESKVEDLKVPWDHEWGLVVRTEYPPARPGVIDLVFADGNRTAETIGAIYDMAPDGVWELRGAHGRNPG
jgi:hypothetical protein